MHNLTTQEKLILLFIISSLILGLGILHFKKSNIPVPQHQLNLNKNVEQIKEEIKKSKQVNINMAGIEELNTLPGVGKVIAGRIIDYRKTQGSFTSKEDIKKVKGIGPKKFDKIKDLLLIE